MSVHPAPSSYCHLVTVPVWPPRVSKVLLVPLQTDVPPETAPALVGGSTVIVASAEFEKQLPICNKALNLVVALMLVALKEDVVLTISIGVVQLSVEDCHFTIDPVNPESVSNVLFVPSQTVTEGEILPPIGVAPTVTFKTVGLTALQAPSL